MGEDSEHPLSADGTAQGQESFSQPVLTPERGREACERSPGSLTAQDTAQRAVSAPPAALNPQRKRLGQRQIGLARALQGCVFN